MFLLLLCNSRKLQMAVIFLVCAQYKMIATTVLYAVDFIYGSIFSVGISEKGSKAENPSLVKLCSIINYKVVGLMDRKGYSLDMEY